MATQKKTNDAKVTAWTPTIRMEFSGTISACALELFGLTQPVGEKSAAQMRETMLKMMQTKHDELTAEGR